MASAVALGDDRGTADDAGGATLFQRDGAPWASSARAQTVTGLLVFLLALLLLSPASALPPTPHSAKHARTALQKLTIAVPASLTGYGRPKFGSG